MNVGIADSAVSPVGGANATAAADKNKDTTKVTDPEAISEKDKSQQKIAQAVAKASEGGRTHDTGSHQVEQGQGLEILGGITIAGGVAAVVYGGTQIAAGSLCCPCPCKAATMTTGAIYCAAGTAAIGVGATCVASGGEQKDTGYAGVERGQTLKASSAALNNEGEQSASRAQQLQAEADSKPVSEEDSKNGAANKPAAGKSEASAGASAGGVNDAASSGADDDGDTSADPANPNKPNAGIINDPSNPDNQNADPAIAANLDKPKAKVE